MPIAKTNKKNATVAAVSGASALLWKAEDSGVFFRTTETVRMEDVVLCLVNPGLWSCGGPSNEENIVELNDEPSGLKPDARAIEILQEYIKSGYTLQTDYSPTAGTPEGRLYCKQGGCQQINRRLRSVLFRHSCVDVDFVNCHPRILLELCKESGLAHSDYNLLEDYCVNRKAYLLRDPKIKNKVIQLIYDPNRSGVEGNLFKQLQAISLRFAAEEPGDGPPGSKLSKKLQAIENKMLYRVVCAFRKAGIKTVSLCYDGIVVEKDNIEKVESVIEQLNGDYAGSHSLSVKPWEDVPTNSVLRKSGYSTLQFDWRRCPEALNELHLKQSRVYSHVHELMADVLPLLALTMALNHDGVMVRRLPGYGCYSFDDRRADGFSFKHLGGKTSAREIMTAFAPVFAKVRLTETVLPNGPGWHPGCFSVASPAKGLVPLADGDDEVELRTRLISVLYHIEEYLCNGDNVKFTFMMQWLARVIRREKTNLMLLITGAQGRGKSMLAKWLQTFVFGEQFCLIDAKNTASAKFNGHLSGKSLVVLEEVRSSDKGSLDLDSLKHLITSDTMVIERKGIEAKQDFNTLNFLAFSNYDSPIAAIQGMERRLVHYTIDSTKISTPNAEYFEELALAMADEKVAQAFARYLCEFHHVEGELKRPPVEAESASNRFRNFISPPERGLYILLADEVRRVASKDCSAGVEIDWNTVSLPEVLSAKVSDIQHSLDRIYGDSKRNCSSVIGKWMRSNDIKHRVLHGSSIYTVSVSKLLSDRDFLSEASCY